MSKIQDALRKMQEQKPVAVRSIQPSGPATPGTIGMRRRESQSARAASLRPGPSLPTSSLAMRGEPNWWHSVRARSTYRPVLTSWPAPIASC